MTKRKAAPKKAAARKAAPRKAATKAASGQYVIFDSPLKPKHFTEEQIERAVKAAA